MGDTFFQDEPVVPEEAPIEKIKVGEDEYTQEDLQRLVGLGKIGAEAESKYKTKIGNIWPKFQQVINEKRDVDEKYRKETETRVQLEERLRQTPPPGGQPVQLTTEQIRAEALKQAEELGIGPGAIRRTVMEVVQGQNLINDISSTIDEMTGEGLPSTTVEEIIQHMQDTGIRNPTKAYKDMFENEWIKNQSAKLNEIKPKGLPSMSQSAAGSKTPAPVRVTKDNLEALVAESIRGNYE